MTMRMMPMTAVRPVAARPTFGRLTAEQTETMKTYQAMAPLHPLDVVDRLRRMCEVDDDQIVGSQEAAHVAAMRKTDEYKAMEATLAHKITMPDYQLAPSNRQFPNSDPNSAQKLLNAIKNAPNYIPNDAVVRALGQKFQTEEAMQAAEDRKALMKPPPESRRQRFRRQVGTTLNRLMTGSTR